MDETGMMVENKSVQQQLDPLVKELLDVTSVATPNMGKLRDLVIKIANYPQASGLAVFMTADLLWQLPDLDPFVLKKLQSAKNGLIKDDLILRGLNLREQYLVDAVETFLQHGKVPSSYFQPTLINHFSAADILRFVCKQTAGRFQSNFKANKDWVFESYSHPLTQNPGVWMSRSGLHYNPQELLKMEKATEASFQQTYVQSQALKSVGKNTPTQ